MMGEEQGGTTATRKAKPLHQSKIPALPDSFFYIPDFINPEEELELITNASRIVSSVYTPRGI